MIERLVTEYFANSLWQVPLLGGTAWLLIRAIRPGVRVRHGMWLAVLACAVVLPLRGVGSEHAVSAVDAHTLHVVAESSFIAGVPAPGPGLLPVHRIAIAPGTLRWLAGLYLATMALGFVRLARSWLAARRLVQSAKGFEADYSTEESRHSVLLKECCELLGVAPPKILLSATVRSPMVHGMFSPALVVPTDFSSYNGSEARAVLLHELAHIKRRDYAANVLCKLMAVPIVYHPATAAVQRQIRLTREMICDDLAAREMASKGDYAWSLLSIARRIAGSSGTGVEIEAVGLFENNNQLEERVMRMMESTGKSAARQRLGRARVARMLVGAAAMVVVMGGAATLHLTPAIAGPRTTGLLNATSANAPAISDGVGSTQPGRIQSEHVEVAAQDAPPSPAVNDVAPTPEPNPSVHPAPGPERAPITHLAPGDAPAAPRAPAAPFAPGAPAAPFAPGAAPVAPVAPVPPDAPSEVAPAAPPAPPVAPAPPARLSKRHGSLGRLAAPLPPLPAPLTPSLQPIPPLAKGGDGRNLDLDVEVRRVSKWVGSPEFRKEMQQAQRQVSEAVREFDSPEFRKQIQESVRINSPAFQKQIEEASKMSSAVAVRLKLELAQNVTDNVQVKEQIDKAQREIINLKSRLDDPAFKRSMEEAQRGAAAAAAEFDSPEFRKRMAEVQKQIESVDVQRSLESAKRAAEESRKALKEK